jgi:copper(I)-binding protein
MIGLVATIMAAPANALFIVNQPWARPAQVGQTTEVYMDLTSTEGAKVIGVRTDAAKTATIRGPGKSVIVTSEVTLPPQVLVALAPGQHRIALAQLLRTLKLGDRVILTLTIERDGGSRQDIEVNAEVRLRSPIDDERRGHEHSHAVQPH